MRLYLHKPKDYAINEELAPFESQLMMVVNNPPPSFPIYFAPAAGAITMAARIHHARYFKRSPVTQLRVATLDLPTPLAALLYMYEPLP